MDIERDELVERVVSAWRPRKADGTLGYHSAWHDLDEAGRREAFSAARLVRRIEAALDPAGLSSTARAVMERIRGR